MRKQLIFLVLLAFLIAAVGSNSVAQRKQPKNRKPKPTPAKTFACVDPLTLSDKEIFIPCQIGYVPTESCPDKTIINVGVKGNSSFDDEGNEIKNEIKYTVSGGRVIESGEYLRWDFSDVTKAGVYTLTAEFLDFNNKLQTVTQTITVRNCDCPNSCVCPPRSVSASEESIKAGEIVTFTAKTGGDLPSDVVYNWTVSNGEIIEGQGTSTIKVKTFPETADAGLTATFELADYNGCPTCERFTSETIAVIK